MTPFFLVVAAAGELAADDARALAAVAGELAAELDGDRVGVMVGGVDTPSPTVDVDEPRKVANPTTTTATSSTRHSTPTARIAIALFGVVRVQCRKWRHGWATTARPWRPARDRPGRRSPDVMSGSSHAIAPAAPAAQALQIRPPVSVRTGAGRAGARYGRLMPDLASRARTLLELHTAPEILVLANVWDVVSARVVAATPGVRALASASHSIASTFGYPDGEQIPLDLHLDMVGRIVAAVEVPVTMDFEAGYGDPGETARRAIEAGAVGGNLEDQMKPLDDAVEAVSAVLAAGRAAGIDFVLNARTDVFGRAPAGADRGDLLAEAIRRGQAFLEAGAPVVFVPGVMSRAEIEALVDGLGRGKLSVIAVPGRSLAVRELQELGVARVSTGPFTQRVALTALQDATAALLAGGTLPADTRSLN